MSVVSQQPLEPVELLRKHGLQVTARGLRSCEQCRLSPMAPLTMSSRPYGPRSVRSPDRPSTTLSVSWPSANLIHRIQPAGSPARFEDRVGDNHHHLVCRSCGELVDVDCAVGVRPCLTAAADAGFDVDEAEVIYWGRCPSCQTGTVSPSAVLSPTTSPQPPVSKTGGSMTPDPPRSES